MKEFEGQNGASWDGQDLHWTLDQLLDSDYADVVESILRIIYNRVLELRQANRPNRPR